MMSFRYEFEELPGLYRDDLWFGMFDGYAEIEFDTSGDWVISSIHLHGDNGQRGLAARGGYTELHPRYDRMLWVGLLTALQHFSADHIEDQIAEELAMEGIIIQDVNREHALTAKDAM